MSIQESLRIVPKGDIALLEWDLFGEKVNKLSTPVMFRLREVVEELKKSSFKAVVMVSRKSKIFIAGADIEEIKRINTKEEFNKVLTQAHEIFNALEDLPLVTIAAINGACLGGGCEMVLACDYRIASDSPDTKIGLPEVKLGILPGFGGCVRLPRTVGLPASLDIILAGKAVDGRKAEKIGLVDACVPAQQLEERALAWAREKIAAGAKKRRKTYRPVGAMNKFMDSFLGRPVVFSQAKKGVLKETKGFYPAPLKALEVVSRTYGMSQRERALAIEAECFIEVATTAVSKNLIDLFYMMEAVKKQTGVEGKDVKPLPVQSIAVLGAGTMGGGIAQVAADKGILVRMKDISNEQLAVGFRHASEIFGKYLKRKRITKYDFDAKMSRISGTLDYSGFQQMDVVIEAIIEDMNLKKKVIAETVKHLNPECIFATNTSSLSVTEMAEAHPHPENFVGMHFFNPVDKMPLVEVIRGPKTSDVATATIFELSKRMGKTPVVVQDGPGFLVNRLLMPYMIEAMFLMQDGMAIDVVDRWYTHKFGMPMGPFRLMDEVGLDVCIKVVKIFHKSLGDRIEVPKLITALNESSRKGKKNGRGFYLYDAKGQQLSVDRAVYGELGLGAPTNPLTEKECLERGVFTMINEASLALIEDRIVQTPQDVDLAMIMGTGFPPFRGGLLKYADALGTQYVAQELELYASKCGSRLRPAQPLANLAKTNRKFYATSHKGGVENGVGAQAERGV
ncbi:MAG: enoyl-CoA hydratase/isomerase family protein [Bdellovibrionales bacterium]|nr:enoyl-CoA hydratase/isomerase family protein [Bdellovibrionales bacterium]